jgi:hypothetical protein
VHFYVCRFTGDGVGEPFRPEVVAADGSTGAFAAIDLRGDSAQRAVGGCVVWTELRPAQDPPSARYLGTDLDATLSAADRARASAVLGVSFDAQGESTLRGLVTRMLTVHADDARPDRPNHLRPGRDGSRRIHLGPRSWDV